MKNKFYPAFFLLALAVQGCYADTPETLRGLQLDDQLAVTWDFEKDAIPQTYNGWGAQLDEGQPRFAAGKHGQGILVEQDSQNFLPASAANCTDVNAFTALRGAKITQDKQGELSTLHVQTDGTSDRQGVEAAAESPAEVSDTWTIAGIDIGGKGRVRVELCDSTNRIFGAPLFVDLKPEMTRVSPAPIDVVVPGGKLVLRVTTADRTPADFRIAHLQIEPGQSATSWMPGGTTREPDLLQYSLSHNTSRLEEGTVFFWTKPNWTPRTEYLLMRDGKKESRTFFSLRNGTSGLVLYWILYNALANGSRYLGVTDIYDNNWHFFALTWKGTSGTIYADGKSVATLIIPIDPRSKFTFGPYANAVIDDAALLTTALPKETLDKVYAAGTPAKPQ